MRFLYVFIVCFCLFASCSSKREALQSDSNSSIEEQIEAILKRDLKDRTQSIDVSVLDGHILIQEIEYSDSINPETKKPLIKKETNTDISLNKRDTSKTQINTADSIYVVIRKDSLENLVQNTIQNSQKEETSFMKYLYRSLIVLAVILFLIFLFLLIRKRWF